MPRPRKLPHELSDHPSRANLEKGRPAPGSEAARLRNAASVATRRVNTTRRRLTVAQIWLDELAGASTGRRIEALATVREAGEDYAAACRARDEAHAAMRAYSTAHTPQAPAPGPGVATKASSTLDDWN